MREILVDPDQSDAALAGTFGLDRIDRLPEFCTGLYADGPLAGQTTHYTPNVLGATVGYDLPPRPGGPSGTYEVVKLAENNSPAHLRHVERMD